MMHGGDMGVWLCAKNKIEVTPKVDDELIGEYIRFSEKEYPKEYRNEVFPNTWFFDTENKLVGHEGKYAEPCVWFDHIKTNFFGPRGYALSEEPEIVGEGENEFYIAVDENKKEYEIWIARKKNILQLELPV